MTANSSYYTGVVARRLGRTDCQFVLQPGARKLPAVHFQKSSFKLIKSLAGETLQVRINWEDYRDKIVDYGHIKVFAMATVHETKQLWGEESDFQLEKPKLDIQVLHY